MKLQAAQEEGCWPDPGCRKAISKGSQQFIAVEGKKVCALTHIPKENGFCRWSQLVFKVHVVRPDGEDFLIEVFITLSSNNPVTLTGVRFEIRAVKNRDYAPTVTNEFCRLQHASCLVYPLTPHTQHVGHEVLGHSKLVQAKTVTKLQIREAKKRLVLLAREEEEERGRELETSNELQSAQARLSELNKQLDTFMRDLEAP